MNELYTLAMELLTSDFPQIGNDFIKRSIIARQLRTIYPIPY